MPSFCKVCKAETNILCSGCKHVYYCGSMCQKKDWIKHKKECKKIRNSDQLNKDNDDYKEECNWSNFVKYPNWASLSDKRNCLISGNCECNGVSYQLLRIPREIQHCYCSICRKMHGSINASWSPIAERDIKFISNKTLTYYKSTDRVKRGFCNKCGCKIYLKYEYQKGLIWLTTASFNANSENKYWHQNKRKMHIYAKSKAGYCMIPNDGYKRLFGT
eukprot:294425_1